MTGADQTVAQGAREVTAAKQQPASRLGPDRFAAARVRLHFGAHLQQRRAGFEDRLHPSRAQAIGDRDHVAMYVVDGQADDDGAAAATHDLGVAPGCGGGGREQTELFQLRRQGQCGAATGICRGCQRDLQTRVEHRRRDDELGLVGARRGVERGQRFVGSGPDLADTLERRSCTAGPWRCSDRRKQMRTAACRVARGARRLRQATAARRAWAWRSSIACSIQPASSPATRLRKAN